MSAEPRTPNGRRAFQLLHSSVNGADFNVNSIQRKFFSYSDAITNEDPFVDRLFQLGVLPTTAENLKESYRTKDARYKYGIEVACKKLMMKEIVVALERTENGHVIDKVLKDFDQQGTTNAQSLAFSVTDSLPPAAQVQIGTVIGGDCTIHGTLNNNVGTSRRD